MLIQKQGYFVLRFLAEDVVGNLNEVMETILSVVKGIGTGVRFELIEPDYHWNASIMFSRSP